MTLRCHARLALLRRGGHAGASRPGLGRYQEGEGEIYLNGRRVAVETSRRSNWRDHDFPPVRIPASWLKFGPEPNVLRLVWRSTAGFIVKKARIVLAEAARTRDGR